MTLPTQAQDTGSKCHWLPASADKLPRWRGFNLLEKFSLGKPQSPFLEEDFRLISKLGFNFVRLPMDYRLWINDGDWTQFNEATLREIDQAVEWGHKYGIHVCINFHRAPGYTVAKPSEKTSLWTDEETQRICALHWATFARRYRGIPNERLSFNLMNEPADVTPEVYAAVVRKLVAAIRQEDPNRLVISDGLQWGTIPVLQLSDLHIAQATRGYTPSELTHYKASWVQRPYLTPPSWPLAASPKAALRDKAWLWEHCIVPWKKAESQGIGIMVGEWGCYNKTSHDIVLRWAEDCLSNWKQANWGWAMWNFRGPFGILDSERADVRYEDFEGHKLDRKLLELIQRY